MPSGGSEFHDPLFGGAACWLVAPPLVPGERFFYDFRIEVTVNGEIRREERRVVVESSQEVAVDFSNVASSPAVATRAK